MKARLEYIFYTLPNSYPLCVLGMSALLALLVFGRPLLMNNRGESDGGLIVQNGVILGEIINHPKYANGKIYGVIIDKNNGIKKSFLIFSKEKLNLGDVVSIECKDGQILYCKNLRILQKTNNFFSQISSNARNFIIKKVDDSFTQSTASLVKGIIIGDSYSIPYFIKENYKQAGIMHIVAVSGFNMNVMAGVANTIFKLLKVRLRQFLSILTMLFYLSVVGFDNIPALRAFIFLSLINLAKAIGRKPNPIYLLILTGIIILFFHPSTINSISYQLSMLAGLAMAVFKKLQSLGVNVFVSPVLAYNFGNINFLGLISNVFILPIIPALTYICLAFIVFPIEGGRLLVGIIEIAARIIQGISIVVSNLNILNIPVNQGDPIFLLMGFIIIFGILLELNYRKFKYQ